MKKPLLLIPIFVLGIASLTFSQAKKPNILVIWGDDIGT